MFSVASPCKSALSFLAVICRYLLTCGVAEVRLITRSFSKVIETIVDDQFWADDTTGTSWPYGLRIVSCVLANLPGSFLPRTF